MFKFQPHTILKIKQLCYIFLWVCLFVVFVYAYWFGFKKEAVQKCSQVDVQILPQELKFVNQQQVIDFVSKKAQKGKCLVGTPLSKLNIQQMEQRLTQIPFVQTAQVYANIEGKLSIELQQRIPIMRVERYDGMQFYIDQNGVKFPLCDQYVHRVLFANGNVFERFEKEDTVYSFVGNELYKVASYVDNDPFLKALIEQIFVRAGNEMVLIPKIGDFEIVLGSTEDLSDKFEKLKVFYKEALNRIGWDNFGTIDLRFKSQVVCKKNKA